MECLYVDAAEATIRRSLARFLQGHSLKGHCGVRASQDPLTLKRVLESRAAAAGGSVLIVADLRVNTVEASLNPILNIIKGPAEQSPTALRTCEILVHAESTFAAEALFAHAAAYLRLRRTPPFVHYYVATPWPGLHETFPSLRAWFHKEQDSADDLLPLTNLLSAFVLGSQSRMFPYDGLARLRLEPRESAYLCQMRRLPVPMVPSLCEYALQKALLERCFATNLPTLSAGEVLDSVRCLFAVHAVGSREPPAGDSVKFTFKKRWYRENLLRPICSRLKRAAIDRAEFVVLLDEVAREAGSSPLGQLLRDVANDIISLAARSAASYSARKHEIEWLGLDPVAAENAGLLAAKQEFCAWPLLRQEIRPTDAQFMADYAGALRTLEDTARSQIIQRLRTIRDAGREAARLAQQGQASIWERPRGFLFVNPTLTTDRYDELWTRDTEVGVLLMTERRLS